MRYTHSRHTRVEPRSRARAVAVPVRPASRRWSVVLAVSSVAAAVCLVSPQAAHAGWPLSGGGRVALGFGAPYTAADGTSATHRGVDLAAEAGSQVRSPLAGRVTFVGKVPGRSGGTVLAVSIAGADGTITMLPLSSADVEAGTDLVEGAAVGELAGTGDDSTREPHLHVGARRGDLYVDPLSLIAPPAAPVVETPEVPETQPAEQPEAAGDVGQPAGAATVAQSGAAAMGSAVPSPSGVSVRQPAGVPTARASAPATVLTPGAVVAPGVQVAGAVADVPLTDSAIGAATSALSARLKQGIDGSGGTSSASAFARWARSAATRAVLVGGRLLAAVLVALGALWPVWRRERRKDGVQLSVRPIDDDVAAVAGQW